MMERSVNISLEEAIKWYNSDNEKLKTLALKAYTEDKLKLKLKYLYSKVKNCIYCTFIPKDEADKYDVLAELEVIAKYFNGEWKKTKNNSGYFLGEFIDSNPYLVSSYNGIGIYYTHDASLYAGVIYFKNLEDIIQAIKILGKKVKNLFI